MQPDGDSGLNLEAQLAHKEREQKELQAVRVHQLESSLKKAQEECSTLRELYLQLREDFQFNLAILDERDKELEKYDVIAARALRVEHKRHEGLNQFNMQIAKLEEQKARGAEKIQEIRAAFERELKQQEHVFNLKMDDMCMWLLSQGIKVKMLSKETEVNRQAKLQALEAFKTFEEFCQYIQTQLQHQEQEIKDLIAVKDHRIKELNNEVKQMETKLKNTEEDNINKYENVLLALKECNAKLEAQCHTHTELMQKAEGRIDKLQENMEVLTAQVHLSQKDHQKAMEKKDEIIQRLHKEVETTQTGWDKHISHASNEMEVKKTEMMNLWDREFKLRAELDRSREEMERYKQQLCAGLEKERNLQQLKGGKLEWQRNCEDMKAEFYPANEKQIQELTHTRDQDFIPRVELLASEEICRLKEQNSILRAAVTQMRKDMECFNHPLFHSQPQATYPQSVQQPGSLAATSIDPTANTQIANGPLPHCPDLFSRVNLSAHPELPHPE
nr:PREDICTED: coiled-coil domain-containing protein 57 isoform X2 [Paralichthys olivaceus]